MIYLNDLRLFSKNVPDLRKVKLSKICELITKGTTPKILQFKKLILLKSNLLVIYLILI